MTPFDVLVQPGHGGTDTGEVADGLVESILADRTAHFLLLELRARGYTAHRGPQIDADGGKVPNANRVKLANRLNAVMVHLHFNGGGGQYGLVEYALDNPQSEHLAKSMQARFRDLLCGHVSDVRVHGLAHGERGYVCIGGANHSAVLPEPLFLDNSDHAAWLKRPESVPELAHAMADAIDDLAHSVRR